jgi:hypothetical protein
LLRLHILWFLIDLSCQNHVTCMRIHSTKFIHSLNKGSFYIKSMQMWTDSWPDVTKAQYLYALEVYCFHVPSVVAFSFIILSIGICEAAEFRYVLIIFLLRLKTVHSQDSTPSKDIFARSPEPKNLVSQRFSNRILKICFGGFK